MEIKIEKDSPKRPAPEGHDVKKASGGAEDAAAKNTVGGAEQAEKRGAVVAALGQTSTERKGKSDQGVADAKNRQPSDTGREKINGVDKETWQHAGAFHGEWDNKGNTTAIEGWLRPNDARRSSQDGKNQKDSKVGSEEKHSQDGGHILAHSLGGPTAESHPDLAKANVIPMDARINRSQIAGIESHLRRELAGGKEIYARAEIGYKEGASGRMTAESVSYRFYERGRDGQPQSRAISGAETKVDRRPAQTTGEAVRPTGGKAADFYSPGKGGTYPKIH